MLDPHSVSTLNYYFRNNLYGHIENYNKDKDFFVNFAKIMAKLLEIEKFPREIMTELESKKRKYPLPCILALIACHQKANFIDKSATDSLEREKIQIEKISSFIDLFIASFFHLHYDRNMSAAMGYAERCILLDKYSALAYSLKGWVSQNHQEIEDCFETALKMDATLCDAVIGRSLSLQRSGKANKALDLCNEFILTNYSDYPIVNEQLIESYLARGLWEDGVELAKKIIKNVDRYSIVANLAVVVHHICNRPLCEIEIELERLKEAVEHWEAGNGVLIAGICSLIRKLACGDPFITQYIRKMLEKTLNLNYQSQPCLLELAYAFLTIRDYSEAFKLFERISDREDPHAYIGVLETKIALGRIEDCSTQIQLLAEIHRDSPYIIAKILFLRAKLNLGFDKTQDIPNLLSQALSIHTDATYSPSNVSQLEPTFIITVSSLLYPYIYVESQKLNPDSNFTVIFRNALFEVNRLLPANSRASFFLANLSMLAEDFIKAREILERAGNINLNNPEINLLQAILEIEEGNVSAAENILEMAVAHSFDIRQNYLYSRVMARVCLVKNDYFLALKYARLGVSQLAGDETCSWLEKVLSMEVLIKVLIAAGQTVWVVVNNKAECEEILENAIKEGNMLPLFHILGAEAAVEMKGDVSHGLVLLDHVTVSDSFYLRAVKATANIYLKYKNNLKLYIACFRKLYEAYPSPTTIMLCGDAYMSITEPDKALSVFKEGMKEYPNNVKLCLKLGWVLTSSHQYGKAISYYETALKLQPTNEIRLKLIEILKNIKLYDKCIRIIENGLQSLRQIDTKTHSDSVKLMIAQAEVYEEMEMQETAIELLVKTEKLQNDILRQTERQQPDLLVRERRVMANLIVKLGSLYWEKGEVDLAMVQFSKARTLNDPKALLKLAWASRMTGNYGDAREICHLVTKDYQKYQIEAKKISIHVDIDCGLYESAIKELTEMVSSRDSILAGNSEQIVLLVEVLRLSGNLEKVEPLLQTLQNIASPATLSFCQALFLKYSGQKESALACFNQARTEKPLESSALFHMADICYQFGSVDDESATQRLRTARMILDCFRHQEDHTIEQTAVETFSIILDGKARSSLNELSVKLGNDSSVLSCYLLGLLYRKTGQDSKAKSVLKRLVNTPWNFENREWLDRGWLLLGSLLASKPKESLLLAQRCLKHNKSSIGAYELMASSQHALGCYEEEIKAYEEAWKASFYCNKSIGLKLATVYLRNKDGVKAIQVCHKVDSPQLCYKILHKARDLLRT